jgi:predicted ATP-dependent protease
MLRSDIVEAVSKEQFSIWAIEQVSEAIELMMDMPAGEASAEGSYPINTVYGIAQAKLNALRK